MLTKNIRFQNFLNTSKNLDIFKIFKNLKKDYLNNKLKILDSLSKNYKYSYNKKILNKYKNFKNFNVIGMGGSVLGSMSIHQFLKKQIKKNFFFIDNLDSNFQLNNKKNNINIIISKSGNTLETIFNSNLLIKKQKNNIFIIENKNNYLNKLANNIKAEIIEHKNYIGGRYSVLSEVGMLPAEFMGLNTERFKRLNYLINNKNFIDILVRNVSNILNLVKKKKHLSVILNYDPNSENLFKWYQQLVAESLGKNKKGITPFLSQAPKDHHSILQLYLDGPKDKFYTFISTSIKGAKNKISKKILPSNMQYLKNKNVKKIIDAQCEATKKIFKLNNIPFRHLIFNKNSEEELGKAFTFFVLETILLARLMKVDPFNQPAVERVKIETSKILLN